MDEKRNALEELLVGDAILVCVRARLAREELGELLVEVDKILGILPTLELVL